jgi:branched-chain amino acid transport system permease protein
MRSRLLRLLVATVAAFVLSWPFVALDADERRGFSASVGPALQVAMVAAVAGLVFVAILEVQERLRARHRPPPAAAGHGAARKWGAPAALCLALAAFPLFRPHGDPVLGLVLDTMTFATIALGLNITIGMAGLLVLGHAAFWAVGAYTFVLTTVHLHWNFWMAFPAAGLAAGAVGLVIGLPALRLRGDYLAVVTLGFGEAIRWVLKNEQHVTGGDAGVPGSEIRGNLWQAQGALGDWLWQPGTGSDVVRECYWFALALLALCVVCVRLLSDSRLGRALYALREDETAARCMGINTTKVKLIAFTSSAMWAGLAGVVTAEYRGSISPDLFDFNMSVLFVAMVVLGGLGSIWGSVLGATMLWTLPVLLQQYLPDVQRFRMLAFGAVMCAMMVVKPEGLLGKRDR